MACVTKGNEVFFQIGSSLTLQLHMMNLEILGPAASLTSPAVALEHPRTKSLIGNWVQAQSKLSWNRWAHDAFGIRSKNSWG